MSLKKSSAVEAAESWSVTYDGELYEDVRKCPDGWYFRVGTGDEFQSFAKQGQVKPICKNLTEKRRRPAGSC